MKKAIIPASFLSVATKNNNAVLENESYMYIIREESTLNQASKLYSLFFGSPAKPVVAISDEQSVSEPDYYSSYE
jgi:hypothetical protein